MKTLLKVVVLLLAVVVAVKVLPILIAIGSVIATGAAGVFFVGGSIVAAVLGVALILITLLSPIWIPLLALVGVLALVRSAGRSRSGMPT